MVYSDEYVTLLLDTDGRLNTKVCDKRDVNFPFLNSDIPAAPAL